MLCVLEVQSFVHREVCILSNNEQPVFPALAVAGKPETEVDLEQYFKPKNMLHCTAKFCDYGRAEGCKEYAEREVRT